MLSRPDTYYVVVFAHKETGKIVASATLFVEYKFLRNAGIVGHVEDVVVDPSSKGQSLGKIMIQGLSELGMSRGCYKIILDCDAKNAGESRSRVMIRAGRRADELLTGTGFYEKCGYKNVGIEMATYKK